MKPITINRKFSKREKIIAVLTIGVMLIFFFKAVILTPLQQKEGEISLKIEEKEGLMLKNLESIHLMKDQQKEYAAYLSYLKPKESLEQEMSAMLSEVEQIGSETGMKILQMKPRKVRTVDFYEKSSLEIDAQAPLPQVVQFLYNVESNARPLIVEEVRMEKKQSSPGELSCNFVISRIFVSPKNSKAKDSK